MALFWEVQELLGSGVKVEEGGHWGQALGCVSSLLASWWAVINIQWAMEPTAKPPCWEGLGTEGGLLHVLQDYEKRLARAQCQAEFRLSSPVSCRVWIQGETHVESSYRNRSLWSYSGH